MYPFDESILSNEALNVIGILLTLLYVGNINFSPVYGHFPS